MDVEVRGPCLVPGAGGEKEGIRALLFPPYCSQRVIFQLCPLNPTLDLPIHSARRQTTSSLPFLSLDRVVVSLE